MKILRWSDVGIINILLSIPSRAVYYSKKEGPLRSKKESGGYRINPRKKAQGLYAFMAKMGQRKSQALLPSWL